MFLFEASQAKLEGVAAMSAEDIGYRAESTANWRRWKAAQFPQDKRNLQAAEELERLARQIEALEGSEVYRQVDDAEESLVVAAGASGREDVWTDLDETVAAELRSIGFHGHYDGAQFLKWWRDLLREALQGVPVAEPDIHRGSSKRFIGEALFVVRSPEEADPDAQARPG
jgi:hypothetical protein